MIRRAVLLERTRTREIASGGNVGVMASRASKSVLRTAGPVWEHDRACHAIGVHGKMREIALGGNVRVMAPRASKSELRATGPAQVNDRTCYAIRAHGK